MSGAWLREEQAGLAEEKILEAAGRAFVDLGVSRTRMGHIAQYAGCSRGTLYRYFKTRHELHLAYVNHWARKLSAELADELRAIDDPYQRLVEGILRPVQKARATPGTAAWFELDASGITVRMSHGSELIDALAEAFVEGLVRSADGLAFAPAGGGEGSALSQPEQTLREQTLRARWLVRVVVSLLTMPGESEEEERALVERFVAPGLLARAG